MPLEGGRQKQGAADFQTGEMDLGIGGGKQRKKSP